MALAVFIFIGCGAQKPFLVKREMPQLDSRQPVFPLYLTKRRHFVVPAFPALVSIAAVGDVMLGSWIVDVLQRQGVDYPFDSTRTYLQNADVAIANLEAPLTLTGMEYPNKKYTFKVPPALAIGIRHAGIDVVNLANNHIVDFGCQGLDNTIAALDSMDVSHIGADSNRQAACQPAVLDLFGVRVAFVGFSMTFPMEYWASDTSCGTCYPGEATLQKAIATAEKKADLTVVSFHWGAEKMTQPKDYQVDYAHRAIDLGADMVIGHHPHVLQGLELYKGKLIAYSLGNYVFGSYSSTAKESIVLQANLLPSGLVYARVIPISVYNALVNFQPRPLRGPAKKNLIYKLNELSRDLNGGCNILDDEGYVVADSVFQPY